jgi:serine/threonine-protein kinase
MPSDSQVRAAKLRRGVEKTVSSPPVIPRPNQREATPVTAADATQTVPTLEFRRLGKFQVLRPLGEGGMGAVYLGYQEEAHRQVAIKVLPDHLAANETYVKRFYREAQSVAGLDHPNIVRFIEADHDAAAGKHYLALEYVDGPSAQALLHRFGRLSVGDAVHIVLDVARALEHAHSRRIIHRDIKPDNILLTLSGVAKLADLGLAKKTDEDCHLTGARQGFGTPSYMPYEQSIDAKEADGRSDIYALGATLYHLVTGELPFPGLNSLDVAERKRVGDFTPASAHNPNVPPSLDRILRRMMAREPGARYQTASELIVELERSNLSLPVPSFVDPELALQDPLMRARLLAPAEPTRLDATAAANRKRLPESDPDIWYLRYRTRDGKVRKARLSTAQIRKRIEEGKLGLALEASHALDGRFRPLKSYREFGAAAASGSSKPTPRPRVAVKEASPVKPIRSLVGFFRSQPLWLVPLGAVVFTAASAVAYLFFNR